jgi:hypothetical protein
VSIGERASSGGGVDGFERLLVPGQEFGDAPRRMVGNAGEHDGEIVLRVEAVELGAFDQRVDSSGATTAGIGAGKQILRPMATQRRTRSAGLLSSARRRSFGTQVGTEGWFCRSNKGYGFSLKKQYPIP